MQGSVIVHRAAKSYIISSDIRNFGRIIESSQDSGAKNIFELYDILQSEVAYVKKEVLGYSFGAFALRAQSGEAIVFVKHAGLSYALYVFVLSLRELKWLCERTQNINTSQTLKRYLKKCEENEPCYDAYDRIFGKNICVCDGVSDDECIYRGIIEYSSVYNCNVSLTQSVAKAYLGAEATVSFEFLNILLHAIFMASKKHENADISVMLESRGRVNSLEILISGVEFYKLLGLFEELGNISNDFCTFFTYSQTDNGARIYTCPYFIDEGLLGVKSKIIFND